MLRYIIISAAIIMSVPAMAQKCKGGTATTPADDKRFTINRDGTVLDIETGLMWQRCLVGMQGTDCSAGELSTMAKRDAEVKLNIANEDKLNGHSDWRFPSIDELSSLVKKGCISPSIDLDIFPNTPNSYVWTVSPNPAHRHFSWYVHFSTGKSGYIWGDRTYALRMVRTAIAQEENPAPIDKSQPYWWKKLSDNQ